MKLLTEKHIQDCIDKVRALESRCRHTAEMTLIAEKASIVAEQLFRQIGTIPECPALECEMEPYGAGGINIQNVHMSIWVFPSGAMTVENFSAPARRGCVRAYDYDPNPQDTSLPQDLIDFIAGALRPTDDERIAAIRSRVRGLAVWAQAYACHLDDDGGLELKAAWDIHHRALSLLATHSDADILSSACGIRLDQLERDWALVGRSKAKELQS